ncbi:hypothetical protein C8J57DRAFT_328939 [Mycena rebaudengoi]|nr:hypothetical protein C8J57DRAFT_328939 [Mycena rebaudengoi]
MGDQGKPQNWMGGTPEGTTGHDALAELVGLGAQHRPGGNGHQGIRVGQSSWISNVHPRPGQRQWDLESIGPLWCGIHVGQDLGAQGSAIMRQESVSAIFEWWVGQFQFKIRGRGWCPFPTQYCIVPRSRKRDSNPPGNIPNFLHSHLTIPDCPVKKFRKMDRTDVRSEPWARKESQAELRLDQESQSISTSQRQKICGGCHQETCWKEVSPPGPCRM